MSNKLLESYLDYTAETESPTQYHRWAFLSAVAAISGRRVYFTLGHIGKIYPNLYCILVGSPGARKDSAMRPAKDLLKGAGYSSFSPESTSAGQFLDDFAHGFSKTTIKPKRNEDPLAGIIDSPAPNLSKDSLLNKLSSTDLTSEVYINIGEFQDFIGINNQVFVSKLTTLWDNLPVYEHRLRKTANNQLNILKPTVNILGGMTVSAWNACFPSEISEKGFTARVVAVYSNPTNLRITFPKAPNPQTRIQLIRELGKIQSMRGELKLSPEAEALLDDIYQKYVPLPDVRLQYYCARRLTHLIKLLIIVTIMKGKLIAEAEDVIEANTILSYTEHDMSTALGYYGESRFALASQKLMDTLNSVRVPIRIDDLWSSVSNDLDKYSQIVDVLTNLEKCGKVTKAIDEINNEMHYIAVKPSSWQKNFTGVNYAKYIREWTKD